MSRELRAELDGERMTIRDAVRALVCRGCDTQEIKSRLGNLTTVGALESYISVARKELGGPLRQCDVETRRIFEEEATARGTSANWLMTRALRIISADGLFEAVPGDELPPKLQRGPQ